MLYVGANDGLLHGFRSGYYDSNGVYQDNDSTIPNDGYESIAYMPAAIVNTIHNNGTAGLDYSSPQYGHNYTVDGTPGTGDLLVKGNWQTWLIGGLGQGGQAIYALDISDPSAFSESNANTLVKGEWTYDPNKASLWNNLGKTYGTPQIRRFHNGQWGAVFGNGWCFRKTNSPATQDDASCQASASGHAGIYVMLLDKDGVPSFRFLDTGNGNGSNDKPNGIAQVTPADLDGDHITDYVYAGDLLGNVWRFDLTSSDVTQWAASSTPLFSTPSGQAITTQITVASSKSPNDKFPRIMLNFGTGIQVPQTLTDAARFAGSTQSLYAWRQYRARRWQRDYGIQPFHSGQRAQ